MNMSVGVVVPVKNRPQSTERLIESFLGQTYRNSELIIVGDFEDTTRPTIERFSSDRVRLVKAEVVSDDRDANAERNVGLDKARGDVLALTDSDIVLPSDWIEDALRLMGDDYEVVAGGMVAFGDGNFLANYIDKNPVGSKTCRFDPPYVITSDNAGGGRYKQPITANIFFTRGVYETVGGLDADFVTPYEDYPYVDTIVWSGYSVLCTHELDVYHSHRDSSRDLAKEYLQAGIGCADYVLRYGKSHLAKSRAVQLTLVVTAAIVWLVCAVLFMVPTLAFSVIAATLLSAVVAWKAGRVSALPYASMTVILSALFSAGMVFGLLYRQMVGQGRTQIVSVEEVPRTS